MLRARCGCRVPRAISADQATARRTTAPLSVFPLCSASPRRPGGRRRRLRRSPARPGRCRRRCPLASGRHGADPVARVAHRVQLPVRRAHPAPRARPPPRRPAGSRAGPRSWPAARQGRAPARACRMMRSSRPSPGRPAAACGFIASSPSLSPSSCSSCLIARWIRTLVAPSERPSVLDISRLSIPSAKRMIRASRRSSGSARTPLRTATASSRPTTRSSVSCSCADAPCRRASVVGLRLRSR